MRFWDDEIPGVWIVKLDGKKRVFESNDNGYPELDMLYVPGPGVTRPKHYTDNSQELIPGAIDKLMAILK
jgi:hypothetical protein